MGGLCAGPGGPGPRHFKEAGIDVDLRFEDDRTNVLAATGKGDIEVDMRTVGSTRAAHATTRRPESSSA